MEDFEGFESRADLWNATKDQHWMEPAEELYLDQMKARKYRNH